MADPRIVSLIASSTEIICALGFEGSLVGRSHECDFPLSVKRLPVCTAPRFETGGSSGEIDRSVKSVLERSLSVYRVDAALLRSLAPTHIVTQAQCEVCAVSLKDVERALLEWTGVAGPAKEAPRVISLSPQKLSDLWENILETARALGAEERGRRLVSSLRGRMEDIESRARGAARRPSVASIEWIDPLMAAGNWMPELVEMAGGQNLFGRAGAHSPALQWEELVRGDPELVVVNPCGFEVARSRADLGFLTARPEWRTLRAAKSGRVAIADGNRFFNRPGPRLVESLEILAEIIHPELFRFGHQGTGWEWFSEEG
jgi:iron complex transport system substrate-binding protein